MESEPEIERRNRQLSALTRVANAASSCLALGEALERVLAVVAETTHSQIGWITSIGNRDDSARLLAGHSPKVDEIQIAELAALSEPLSMEALRSGKPLFAFVEEDPRLEPLVRALEGMQSFASVPLKSRRKTVGLMNLIAFTPGTLTIEHIGLLETIGSHAAAMIEIARLNRLLEQKVRELTSLYEIGLTITSSLSEKEVLFSVMRSIDRILPAEGACLLLFDEEPDQESLKEVLKYQEEASPPDKSGCWTPAVALDVNALFNEYTLRVPLKTKGQTIGLIEVRNKIDGRFREGDLELLTQVAALVAVAIENARLLETAQAKADELSLLLETVEATSSSLDPIEILQTLSERLTTSLPVTFSRISLLDERGENLVLQAAHSIRPLDWDPGIGRRYALADLPLHRKVMESDEVVIIRQEKPEQAMGEFERRAMMMEEIRSGALLPLKAGERTMGVISLGEMRSWERAPFSSEKLRLCRAIADEAAMAIQRARLYEDLRRGMEQLRSTQGLLRQSEKLSILGEMAAGIAHEINNPLVTILGCAQLLQEIDLPQEAEAYTKSIERGAEHTMQIVHSLLGFVRQRKMERTAIDINQTIREALALQEYQLKVNGIEVVEEFADDLPLVMADLIQLQQVFLNITNNAHQAMVKTKGKRTLTVRTQFLQDDAIRISFADTGPGIPSENLDKIFDSLFTTRGSEKGTGLGLSISRRIVRNHGGCIWAESEPGKGATFFIDLPLTQEPVPNPEGANHGLAGQAFWHRQLFHTRRCSQSKGRA